jgi:hypothetical protein
MFEQRGDAPMQASFTGDQVMNARKTVCIISLFALVLAGCYSESILTKGTPAPSDQTVYFYMRDGSYVKADKDCQKRIEGGYQVGGYLYSPGKATERFSGVIHDSEIQKMTAKKVELGRVLVMYVSGCVLMAMVIVGLWGVQ